jgi:hypothetical protein
MQCSRSPTASGDWHLLVLFQLAWFAGIQPATAGAWQRSATAVAGRVRQTAVLQTNPLENALDKQRAASLPRNRHEPVTFWAIGDAHAVFNWDRHRTY